MSLDELQQKVIAEYDHRELKSSVRYKQLGYIVDFLKNKYENSSDCLSRGKEALKEEYRKYRGKERLSGADKSAFNEMYNQWEKSNCSY